MKTIEGIGFKFCYDELLYSVEVRGLFDLLLLVLKIYRSEKGVLVRSDKLEPHPSQIQGNP